MFIFLLVFFNSYSQEKEKIIFLFEDGKDNIFKKRNETVYRINNNHTFRFTEKKHKKSKTEYKSVKGKIISYNDFLKKNKEKKYPEFFNEYSFYIFILEKDGIGCLIEVEKVWLVEEKITD